MLASSACCRRSGWRGKFGGLRGFFLGGELLGLFPLLAFDAQFVKFVAFARLVGELLVVFARADLALGETVILHQRDMAGADIAACAALDAVEQAECLRLAEFLGLREPVQILRLQIRRAHFYAARAAYARHRGRRRRENFVRCGDDAVGGFHHRHMHRGQRESHHRAAHDVAIGVGQRLAQRDQFVYRRADQRLVILRPGARCR